MEFPIARQFPRALSEHALNLTVDGYDRNQEFYVLQDPNLNSGILHTGGYFCAHEEERVLQPPTVNPREVMQCQRWILIRTDQNNGTFDARMEDGNQFVIVKKIPKAPNHPGSDIDPYKEVAAMRFLNPFVNPSHHAIACLEALEDDKFVFIVIPYGNDGDLCTYLENHEFCGNNRLGAVFTNAKLLELLHVFGQVVSNVQYLHEQNVCHLDIKPDNILVKEDPHNPTTTLIDMASCQRMLDDGTVHRDRLVTFTPQYRAPEIGNAQQPTDFLDGEKLDVWSLGVSFFFMLTGSRPYRRPRDFGYLYFCLGNGILAPDPNLLGANACLAHHRVAAVHLEGIRIDVRGLLRGMLQPNPNMRLPLYQVHATLENCVHDILQDMQAP